MYNKTKKVRGWGIEEMLFLESLFMCKRPGMDPLRPSHLSEPHCNDIDYPYIKW